MFLKKYSPEKRGFEGKYASFKNIKFTRGNNQADITCTLLSFLLSLLFTTKFPSILQLKNHVESFPSFLMKVVTGKFKKKTDNNPNCVSVEDYRLIAAPRRFDVLKEIS